VKAYTINPDVIVSELDGVKTIFNPDTGLYFGLDDVGTFVWDSLSENSKPIEEILREITNVFDVQDALLENDINALIDEMHLANLIVISDVKN
jgi:hypothetical protein